MDDKILIRIYNFFGKYLNIYDFFSKLSKIRKPTLIAPTPDVFVKSALNTLGIKIHTTGFWLHDVMVWILNDMLPEWLATKITHDSLIGIRKSALKKKSKQQ